MKQQSQILQKLASVEELMKAESSKPLNTDQAAQYLGIRKSSLFKLTSGKKIPYFCPSGKLIYFKKSDLDNFIFRNRQDTNAELEAQANSFVNRRKVGAR